MSASSASPSLRDRAAIVGMGQTEFSKSSGRSELQLAAEAAAAALDDAGLRAADVDGMVIYTLDATNEIELVRNLGVPELTFYARVPYGGGGTCGVVLLAAMAVATGAANVVRIYRAFNEAPAVVSARRAISRRARPPAPAAPPLVGRECRGSSCGATRPFAFRRATATIALWRTEGRSEGSIEERGRHRSRVPGREAVVDEELLGEPG